MIPIRSKVVEKLFTTLEILNGHLLEVKKVEDIFTIVDSIEEISTFIKMLYSEKGE